MTTPSQTVGPFFEAALPWPEGPVVVADGFWIRGTVLDGAGEAVPDALVETWQADPDGRYHGDRGFGRCPTDAAGGWAVRTVQPGPVDGQAPHLAVSVFARGLLNRVVTRVYFPDDAEARGTDPVLASVDPDRRATLVATPAADGYRFDVRLQGDGETVFFDV